jgi:hypothetical protein
MAGLLKRLHLQNVSVDYIEELLAAFSDAESIPRLPDSRFESEAIAPIQNPKCLPRHSPAGRRRVKIQNSLVEPLTNREHKCSIPDFVILLLDNRVCEA